MQSKQAILAFFIIVGIYYETLDILVTYPGKNSLSKVDFPWAFTIWIFLTGYFPFDVLTCKIALTAISE